MQVELGLNLLWVCCALCALGMFAAGETRRTAAGAKGRFARALAIVFALVVLFPSVSESDDRLNLLNLPFTAETRGEVTTPAPQRSSGDRPSTSLVRAFESLEHATIAAPYAYLPTVLAVCFVLPKAARVSGHLIPVISGRAPPATASA